MGQLPLASKERSQSVAIERKLVLDRMLSLWSGLVYTYQSTREEMAFLCRSLLLNKCYRIYLLLLPNIRSSA